MRLDSPALHVEQSRFPNQTRKEPRFSWCNTREFPWTLSRNEMNTDAPQECKIDQCTTNQLEMKPISPSLAPSLSHVPQNTVQVAWLPWGNYRDSLRHPPQVYMNIHFSTASCFICYYFLYSESCLFTLLTVSLAVQKLLSLIRSRLFTLVFIPITLGGGCRGSCFDLCHWVFCPSFPLRVL